MLRGAPPGVPARPWRVAREACSIHTHVPRHTGARSSWHAAPRAACMHARSAQARETGDECRTMEVRAPPSYTPYQYGPAKVIFGPYKRLAPRPEVFGGSIPSHMTIEVM